MSMMHLTYEERVAAERQAIVQPRASRPRVAWLYTRHFGLREAPFSLTPDTRFFFSHQSCQEAVNTLMVAIRGGEGFTKVTGEVGTGKTMLCRSFLGALDDDYVTTYIPNPYLEPMTLLLAIADELGVSYPDNVNQHQLLKALTEFLIKTYSRYNRAVVVCLDEAHVMPAETLEVLRLLSNLETQQRKLLQLVLFGQPELDKRLNKPSIRQLKQRISFSCRLKPLSINDVEYYIVHRLNVAGYSGPRLFSPTAIKLIYKASKGVPRLVNILAHKSMMAAFGEGSRSISDKHIRLAIRDTESMHDAIAAKRKNIVKLAAATVASVLLFAASLLAVG